MSLNEEIIKIASIFGILGLSALPIKKRIQSYSNQKSTKKLKIEILQLGVKSVVMEN